VERGAWGVGRGAWGVERARACVLHRRAPGVCTRAAVRTSLDELGQGAGCSYLLVLPRETPPRGWRTGSVVGSGAEREQRKDGEAEAKGV
jgi:hypothetical protein